MLRCLAFVKKEDHNEISSRSRGVRFYHFFDRWIFLSCECRSKNEVTPRAQNLSFRLKTVGDSFRVRAPHECQRLVSIPHISWAKPGRTGSILNMPLEVKTVFKGTAEESRSMENMAAQHGDKVLTHLTSLNGGRFLAEAVSSLSWTTEMSFTGR